nr:MAG TPA: hypothetical protein [Bacteriophage sp.]
MHKSDAERELTTMVHTDFSVQTWLNCILMKG